MSVDARSAARLRAYRLMEALQGEHRDAARVSLLELGAEGIEATWPEVVFLSRLGQGSRVVLTHDVAQRDNLRVGRHDGVVAVVEKLKGHPLFAHVTLTRSERSPIAALVTEMLENVVI